MRMPLDKQIAFLEKVLAETQKNPATWNQCMSDCIAANRVFRGLELDREGVFSYIFPHGMRGEFWIAKEKDGSILGALGSDTDRMEWFDHQDESVKVLLTRLFYLNFDRRPNANKILDVFLNLGENEEESST